MRVMGRNTQGVKVINLKTKDEIAAIAKVVMDSEVVEDEAEEGAENDSNNPEFKLKPQKADSQTNNEESEESDTEKTDGEETSENSDKTEDKE